MHIIEKRKNPSSKKRRTARSAFLSFFLPGGLLFLITSIILILRILDEVLPRVASIYPYVVFGAGVLVSCYVNRRRILFVILVLAIADRSLVYFAAGPDLSIGGRLVYNAVPFFLPLNLILFSLIKEKGILTRHSIWCLFSILLQGGIVALIYLYPELGLGAYLEYKFMEGPLPDSFLLSQPALFSFGIALLFFMVRYIQGRGALESAFFWALLSAFVALVTNRIGPVSTIYFSTAGLILVISLMERFYVLGFRDEVTGLPSRRALNEALSRLGTGYTVAMIDIDFFKKINDQYGHSVGDQVLGMVAAKLENVTGGGKSFRYGGEEFIIIFPGKFLNEAIPHLERLRIVIKNSGFILRGPNRLRQKPQKLDTGRKFLKRIPVTISIGVSERSARHMSAEQVIRAADEALYLAKKAGRNRIRTRIVEEE